MRDYTLTVANEMDHLLLLLLACTVMKDRKKINTPSPGLKAFKQNEELMEFFSCNIEKKRCKQ